MDRKLRLLQQTESEIAEEELSESEMQQIEPEEVTIESLLLDQLDATKELMSVSSDICEHQKDMHTALSDIRKINLAILKELRDEADEGGRMHLTDLIIETL